MDLNELEQLELATIGELEPGAAEAFQVCLRRIVADCIDRPGDPAARTVTMKVSVVPIMLQSGGCDEASVEIECVGKSPAYRTKSLSLGIRRSVGGGMLVFRRGSPGNVNQQALSMGDDE